LRFSSISPSSSSSIGSTSCGLFIFLLSPENDSDEKSLSSNCSSKYVSLENCSSETLSSKNGSLEAYSCESGLFKNSSVGNSLLEILSSTCCSSK